MKTVMLNPADGGTSHETRIFETLKQVQGNMEKPYSQIEVKP
jgi:hypothetical protein